ncbi:MAG: UDP-N-acetylmuramoyl-L-alanine--D-glutamate ligase [Flavobacteriales bacterium]|nr:UDP-N-acetylmuramoyl-L-alanine--D-glutamate ligase [Flavobacteriales bacterium]
MTNASLNIVILGAGESGYGAAYLAKIKNHNVFVSDFGSIGESFKTKLQKHQIEFEEGQHSEDKILLADIIIKSPGIPNSVDIVKKAVAKGIEVISEIEFASRYTDAILVGVTGSNGKTTTASLLYHMLQKGGYNVGLAGNIGTSFALSVATEDFDYYVLELSSFQLENIEKLKLKVSILLNITPDHLDRYEYDIQKYVEAKFNILKNQDENDFLIYNQDDDLIAAQLQKEKLEMKTVPFSIQKELTEGAYLNKNEEIFINHQKPFIMSIHDLALQGKHNIYNSMASSIAARILELRKEIIRESLSDFQNVEHRLEPVGKVHGIEFINDSKATNVNSTWYALESMDKPVIWIVGGVDKGNDYDSLREVVKDKVKAIICLGLENEKIHAAFEGVVEEIQDAMTAQEAVSLAYNFGRDGDAVLLSPACASFDLFENYEDRGRQFKEAVKAL